MPHDTFDCVCTFLFCIVFVSICVVTCTITYPVLPTPAGHQNCVATLFVIGTRGRSRIVSTKLDHAATIAGHKNCGSTLFVIGTRDRSRIVLTTLDCTAITLLVKVAH